MKIRVVKVTTILFVLMLVFFPTKIKIQISSPSTTVVFDVLGENQMGEIKKYGTLNHIYGENCVYAISLHDFIWNIQRYFFYIYKDMDGNTYQNGDDLGIRNICFYIGQWELYSIDGNSYADLPINLNDVDGYNNNGELRLKFYSDMGRPCLTLSYVRRAAFVRLLEFGIIYIIGNCETREARSQS